MRALIWASALAVGANEHRMTALTKALRDGVPIVDIARAPDARTIREPWALGGTVRHRQGQGALSPEEFESICGSLIAGEKPPACGRLRVMRDPLAHDVMRKS
ncbi:hypothetical protein [Nonomuraea longicatena]|uniref:hypothetical protein n=1 Tax=Nonomuraea longicatena TaxID=83682 RepID=UPI0031DF08D0